MVDIRRIVDLYDLYKSYRRVARELKISRNTVKKYVLRAAALPHQEAGRHAGLIELDKKC